MGFYSRVIFPRLCDWALAQPMVAEQRRRLLADAGGDVLEIGFGTGLNLPHYPQGVRKIAAVDPNVGMQRRAERRMKRSGIHVEQYLAGGERLPFRENTFDCVVSTFTLCSVADPIQTLSEVFRVLKPTGRFLLLEHGLSPDASVQRWQRRLNWLQQRIGGGCHLDRNMKELVAALPFSSTSIDEFYLEKTPKTHGYIYRGSAMK